MGKKFGGFGWHCMVSKNFSMEISSCHVYRAFSDGVSFIDFDVDLRLNKEFDHAPQFVVFLAILNLVLVDFSWHNIHHADCDDQCDKGPVQP